MKDPTLGEAIPRNPVRMARPKAPRAYQNESAQALADSKVRRLLDVVRVRADAGNVTAKRDYALLLFYLLTGMRRREVIQLRWGDIKLDEVAVIRSKAKGGLYSAREIRDPAATDALLDYLRASGRLSGMKTTSPLWTRHDRAGQAGR